MTDRELMQQALDALQEYVGVVVSVNDPNDWTPKVADAGEPARKAIEALRARLAQPEPEPVACIVKGCRNHRHEGHFVGDLCAPCHTFITANEGKYSQAYRNAQREWQGLTDEEITTIGITHQSLHQVARAIEAKLKEKNA